jgi:voltage-gated potassium channel
MTDAASGRQQGRYDKIQEQVYVLLESQAGDNKARKFIIYFIAALILLNVIVVILETKHEFFIEHASFFHAFDFFTVIVFTVEYGLRVWVCVRNPLYSSPVKGRLRFALSPFALVDLIAITPFYLPLFVPIELRLLRMLRLLRVFRVLKLGRYSNAFDTFVDVLRSKKEEMVIGVIIATIILILSSSAMFFVEYEAQPVKFASIPDAMWWAVITLTTVGYGDVYPMTVPGKIIGALVAISAIGLIAFPAGLFASGFAESIQKRRTRKSDKTIICPQCGEEFDMHAGAAPGSSKKTGEIVPFAEERNDSEIMSK